MVIQKRIIPGHSPEMYSDILARAKSDLSDTIQKVIPILDSVRKHGDLAVREFTEKFDGWVPDRFVYEPNEVDTGAVPESLKIAFQKAKENIESFHRSQVRPDWETEVSGNRLGFKYTPIDSVTVYAPGGKALYPSSVLMGVIPAKIAGVPNIQIATPPQKGGIPPVLGYVAQLVGANRIITVGGAQAIAAVSYGTETIPKSEFIVGPGNSFVAAAKVYLSGLGLIGIESPAGPSEVLVIADQTANPKWVACDLLSQAEHGEDSAAILATDSEELLLSVEKELEIALSGDSRRNRIKRKSIEENGYLLKFDSIRECVNFSNDYAPEHLEILTENYNEVFRGIRHAGSVFLGHYSPVAMGDYISGTNHILPTAGGSKLFSGLGVDHFRKRISFQEVRQNSLLELYQFVKEMSESEGLEEEHGRSVYLRTLDK